ncbi:reticulon-2a isoform X1 [Megalops cyprinoides]|uniref:reticulon-2a isoform X1 n=1 Tax=Megalops cyprinoides TaxID=118141 RepID=UPI00186542C8|nr:reticulon-2a isoform X1 [Megalops cyprinoides]
MGQVLGFSHCKEFGSVSSTPDSTPPCTDGGNEESDFPELQTAREWSEDEDDGEEDEGGTSSPSVWGTPRQNSFELTFSYIAFTEPEAGGASRRDSMGGGRRRGGSRGGRAVLSRVDTEESLLPSDSPEADWEHHTMLSRQEEEEEEVEEEGPEGEQPQKTPSLELRDQPPPSHSCDPEPQDRDPECQSSEQEEPSGTQHHDHADSFSVLLLPGADSLIAAESTTALCASVQPESGVTDVTSSTSSSSIGQNTQEEPISEQWFSTLNLSEGNGRCIQITVMDLIYWRDTERTGMVFTGLVVGLLSLFQLSIITVVSTVSLAIVCCTIAVRIYYKVLHVLQWGDGKHPFQSYLDLDISLTGEQAVSYMERLIVTTTTAIAAIKRLFFVGSLIDSLKFLFLMYLLTYVGDLFNGLTLLIIAVICLFSLPLFYKQHQAQVDGFLEKVKAHVDNIKDIFHRLFQGGSPTPDPDPAPGGAKPKTK